MDEPSWQWPAWKFGMRRDDLFTKLHDQYNTIPSSIQDPEAFHHDVFEISNVAATKDEFHRLLSDRKEQRIRELNDTLESASLEIIANPSLIGTQQWQHAVQLFRTKSLDSLVRYFSSYLPEDHPWHNPLAQGKTAFDTIPTSTSMANKVGTCIARDPYPITTSFSEGHFPPSPTSLTTYSDEGSAVSPIGDDHHNYDLNTLTPARTMSFSEPEPETDLMVLSGTLSNDHDDDEDTSQSDDPDTPITSISDLSELRSLPDHGSEDEAFEESTESKSLDGMTEVISDDDVSDTDASEDQETPTPRQAPTDSYMPPQSNKKFSVTEPRHDTGATSSLYTQVLQEYVRTSRKSRREGSPGLSAGRRSSPEHTRIAKQDPLRLKPKARRRG